MSWNVRGLNERDKRLVFRQLVLMENPDIVCFQETKLNSVNASIVKEICGRCLAHFQTLNAEGTRGGILMA